MSFPAKQINTDKPLKELPFNEQQAGDIQRMIDWLKSGEARQREPKTFQALFVGPPGSGKKSTAIHIAQETHCGIFKIDTCELLTKYIGKAEENLEILFTRAEQKQWILYFDEADSLFGKNNTANGNGNGKEEKQASIEINSLLRSIQFYPGLVILTTKKKKKIDPSYLSRFNAIVDFSEEEES